MPLVNLLYGVSAVLLLGAAWFVGRREPHGLANRLFALTTLALWVWVVTLWVFENVQEQGWLLLWVGRLNFAAIVLVLYLAYRFVWAVTGLPDIPSRRSNIFLLVETLAACRRDALHAARGSGRVGFRAGGAAAHHAVRHALPALPDARHRISCGHRVGGMGDAPCHREGRGARPTQPDRNRGGGDKRGVARDERSPALSYNNFDYIDWGPFSTILFLLAVAYAVAKHNLFNIRLFIRKTLVIGLLLSFVLSVYGALTLLATEWLTQGSADLFTRFGVFVIALSFDPLRRYLERQADAALEAAPTAQRKRRS